MKSEIVIDSIEIHDRGDYVWVAHVTTSNGTRNLPVRGGR